MEAKIREAIALLERALQGETHCVSQAVNCLTRDDRIFVPLSHPPREDIRPITLWKKKGLEELTDVQRTVLNILVKQKIQTEEEKGYALGKFCEIAYQPEREEAVQGAIEDEEIQRKVRMARSQNFSKPFDIFLWLHELS